MVISSSVLCLQLSDIIIMTCLKCDQTWCRRIQTLNVTRSRFDTICGIVYTKQNSNLYTNIIQSTRCVAFPVPQNLAEQLLNFKPLMFLLENTKKLLIGLYVGFYWREWFGLMQQWEAAWNIVLCKCAMAVSLYFSI